MRLDAMTLLEVNGALFGLSSLEEVLPVPVGGEEHSKDVVVSLLVMDALCLS